MRATDTVARLGGDEFVVLLPGLHKKDDPERIARKIVKKVRLGFRVNGKTLTMTTSIGVAYAPEAAVTAEALFASADQALYAAKNADRNRFECWSSVTWSKSPGGHPAGAMTPDSMVTLMHLRKMISSSVIRNDPFSQLKGASAL